MLLINMLKRVIEGRVVLLFNVLLSEVNFHVGGGSPTR